MQLKPSIKQRMLHHIDIQGISKYEFYKITGITRGILDKENWISEENIKKYINHYPEINPEWLLTGNGPMLRSIKGETEKFSNVPQPLGDTQSSNPQESIEQPNFSFSDRLDHLFRHYNISGYRLAKELNISESTISNYRNGKSWPTVDFLNRLTERYNDANLNWLLTGKGSMIHSLEEEIISENTPQTSEESQIGQPVRIEAKNQKAIAYSSDIKEKDLIIESLETQLAEQKQSYERIMSEKDRLIEEQKVNLEQIVAGRDKQICSLECQIGSLKAGFEKQIEDLRNNLGMVIASKDEMLAMKEDAIKGKEATLAAKDEIISIQSKRISELESHNEAEDLKKILGTSERIGQESTSLTDIHPKDLFTKAKKGEHQV